MYAVRGGVPMSSHHLDPVIDLLSGASDMGITKQMSLAAVLLGAVTVASPSRASGQAENVLVGIVASEAKEYAVDKIKSMWKSWSSEHSRFFPQGDVCIIPLGDLGGTRASFNFDHQSWVPRGSDPVRVKIEIKGIDDDDIRKLVYLMPKADKQGRKDRDRLSDEDMKRLDRTFLIDGDEFTLSYGTSGDRAYYFVERNNFNAMIVPSGAYIKLTKLD